MRTNWVSVLLVREATSRLSTQQDAGRCRHGPRHDVAKIWHRVHTAAHTSTHRAAYPCAEAYVAAFHDTTHPTCCPILATRVLSACSARCFVLPSLLTLHPHLILRTFSHSNVGALCPNLPEIEGDNEVSVDNVSGGDIPPPPPPAAPYVPLSATNMVPRVHNAWWAQWLCKRFPAPTAPFGSPTWHTYRKKRWLLGRSYRMALKTVVAAPPCIFDNLDNGTTRLWMNAQATIATQPETGLLRSLTHALVRCDANSLRTTADKLLHSFGETCLNLANATTDRSAKILKEILAAPPVPEEDYTLTLDSEYEDYDENDPVAGDFVWQPVPDPSCLQTYNDAAGKDYYWHCLTRTATWTQPTIRTRARLPEKSAPASSKANRRCTTCGEQGHNKRTCPQRMEVDWDEFDRYDSTVRAAVFTNHRATRCSPLATVLTPSRWTGGGTPA